MRYQPSASEVTSYRDNGFVVVPGMIEADELDLWREVVGKAVEDRADEVIPGLDSAHAAESLSAAQQQAWAYQQKVFTQRVNLWQTDEALKGLITDPLLGGFAAELAGVEGLRIWHDQALSKPPYGNPTSFHLDVPYWSFSSPDAISVWVALDDATVENGCLWYVPGSHKAANYDSVPISKELGALFDIYPDWATVPAVPCPVPAGGAIFHNGLVFHGAGANMTPYPRRAMTCGYMPVGARFNGQQNILPPEVFAALQIGDLLDDDTQNPLVYDATALSVGSA